MKKRIAIFVVLAMVLCLALTGCGQSDKRTEDTGNVVENGRDDGFADDGSTTNGEWEAEPEEGYSGTVWDIMGDDAPIDRPGSDSNNAGDYSYDVAGHTLVLRTDLDEYLKNGIFFFNKLATNLGWHPRNPDDAGKANLMRYFYGDDNECVAEFENPTDDYYLRINAANSNTGATAEFIFANYGITSNGELYNVNANGSYKINRDQAIIMAYLLENTFNATDKSYLRDVFTFENNICYLYD